MTALNETLKTLELLPPKNKILDFAGTWKDMNDNDFNEFIENVYERRKESFRTRRQM